jgi:hypothetical protein
VDILIIAISALVAALVVLAVAVLWVASRYDRVSRRARYDAAPNEPAAAREQRSPAVSPGRRLRPRSRTRASARR